MLRLVIPSATTGSNFCYDDRGDHALKMLQLVLLDVGTVSEDAGAMVTRKPPTLDHGTMVTTASLDGEASQVEEIRHGGPGIRK